MESPSRGRLEFTSDWHKFFSVHHLFYDFIGDGLYRTLRGHFRVLYLMQWTNCVAGGFFLYLAFRLFRSFDIPAGNAAACAAIIGSAATFWKFTTDVDSYILANTLLVRDLSFDWPLAGKRRSASRVCDVNASVERAILIRWPWCCSGVRSNVGCSAGMRRYIR